MCSPGESPARSLTPRASWQPLAVACRWSRRARISHLLPLAFRVATGKFDTTLRPYSSSAGDGRWLSIGVALSTVEPHVTPASVEPVQEPVVRKDSGKRVRFEVAHKGYQTRSGRLIKPPHRNDV